jgi:hypothetical protein
MPTVSVSDMTRDEDVERLRNNASILLSRDLGLPEFHAMQVYRINRVLARLERAEKERDEWRALAEIAVGACRAVVGHGYCEQKHPAGQDYVSKSAIALVRAALKKRV